MGATGHFKHIAEKEGAFGITAAYTNNIPVVLAQTVLIHSSAIIQLNAINTGIKTTFRITSDIQGDHCLVPDTTADISLGKTTATDGTSVYKIDVILPSTTTTVYVWVKLDAGTANVDKVTITGYE